MRRHPEQINVSVIGFGNIGTGVVRYFHEDSGNQHNIHLKRVAVRHPDKTRAVPFSPLTTEVARDIIRDPGTDIVVELMGGVNPALDYMLDAIDRRKHVVTANKAALSKNMRVMFDAARSRQVNLGFEASVAGGIPVINIMTRLLRGERFQTLTGIVNGTTNYMLTKMDQGDDYLSALAGAQRAGFAEQDPRDDVEGYDPMYKLAILASLGFNTQVDLSRISRVGITGITRESVEYARHLITDEAPTGHVIKLLAAAKINKDNALELSVGPKFISRAKNPLATVNDEFNAITINWEWADAQTYIGRGAGERPTTSAVISNIIDTAEHIRNGTVNQLPTLTSKVTYAASAERMEDRLLTIS